MLNELSSSLGSSLADDILVPRAARYKMPLTMRPNETEGSSLGELTHRQASPRDIFTKSISSILLALFSSILLALVSHTFVFVFMREFEYFFRSIETKEITVGLLKII